MVQRKLLVVVVCGVGGAIWGCAKPKIKMTAMTRLDAEQIYPTDASCKLNNPWRLCLCVMWCVCVCVWVSACVRACVWCGVQYARLLTRSWRLGVKLDSWLHAGVNTWHRARLQLRWITAHVRRPKCQCLWTKWGWEYPSVWEMLYWLLWCVEIFILFCKKWFSIPVALSDESVPFLQHCHISTIYDYFQLYDWTIIHYFYIPINWWGIIF